MKKHFAVAIAGVFGLVITSTALAADSGVFIGLSAGKSTFKHAKQNVDDVAADTVDFLGAGFTATSSVEETDSASKITLGYKFGKSFGIEVAYNNLGASTFNVTATDGGDTGTVNGTFEAKAITLALRGGFHFGELGLFGKIGGASWTAEYSDSYSDTLGTTDAYNAKKTGTGGLIGFGLNYNLTKQFAIVAEMERFVGIGTDADTGKTDVDLLSAGVTYRF